MIVHLVMLILLGLVAAPAPLKQEIRDGVEALAPRAEAAIEGAGSALEYFHQQGWVHRDVRITQPTYVQGCAEGMTIWRKSVNISPNTCFFYFALPL